MSSGIYKIESISHPDRIYIGSAINFSRRFIEHRRDLKKNKHHSGKLQNHVNKYGINDLAFSIIKECDFDNLLKEEQVHIDNLSPYFNVCSFAGSRLHSKVTQKTRDKISASNKGRIVSEETRKKIGDAHRGRKHSEISIEHFRAGQAKRILNGFVPHNKGKKSPPELVEKCRLAHIGLKLKPCSEERKRKIGLANKGRTVSDETRMKISIACSKRRIPPEQRAKMSVSAKLRWAKFKKAS